MTQERQFVKGDRVEAVRSFGLLRRVPKGSRGTVVSAGEGQPLKVQFDEFSVDMINRQTAAGPATREVSVRPAQIALVATNISS